MRIIGGSLKGRKFNPPSGLPVRPTTDFAKEGLFNILANQFDFGAIKVLDLFTGTGNISFEFASRGCQNITSVDLSDKCIRFINEIKEKFQISAINTVNVNIFQFIKTTTDQYDVIFADPPYEMRKVFKVPELVFKYELLKPGGWLVIEHKPQISLEGEEHFLQMRKYGSSIFSIFQQG